MRLALHLLGADARRLAGPIALWISIVVIATIVDGIGPPAAVERSQQQIHAMTVLLVWLAGAVLSVTLVAVVVQQHPAIGTRAWWMTRPVPPRMLLGSRLLLLGLLIVAVPAVSDVVLMAVHRVPPGQMLRVFAEWSLIRFVGLGVVMLGAALTTTFARFAVLMIGSLIVGLVGMNIAFMVALSDSPAMLVVASSGVAATLISRPNDAAGSIVAWIVVIAASLLALRLLYRTRSRPPAVAIGFTGVVLALIAAVAWPWPLLRAETGAPEWASSPDTLRISAFPQDLYFDNAGIILGSQRWRTAHARLFITNIPEGWIATARLKHGKLEFPGGSIDGGPLRRSEALPTSEIGSPVERALRHVLGVGEIASHERGSATVPILMTRAENVPSTPLKASYRGEFAIDTLRLLEVASLPLRAGASFADDGYRLVIEGVQTLERGAAVRVRTSLATSAFDREPKPTYTFYLRNRQLGDAVSGTQHRWNITPLQGQILLGRSGFVASVHGFTVARSELQFLSSSAAQLTSSLPSSASHHTDESWLRGAELVAVKTVDAGTVTRRLEIDGLSINPQ